MMLHCIWILHTGSGKRQQSGWNGIASRQWYNVEVFDVYTPVADNTATIAHTQVRKQL